MTARRACRGAFREAEGCEGVAEGALLSVVIGAGAGVCCGGTEGGGEVRGIELRVRVKGRDDRRVAAGALTVEAGVEVAEASADIVVDVVAGFGWTG